jgi:hypothetical protein
MAYSNTSICNLALQKLGAARITNLPDGSANSNECNAAFEHVRDGELRTNKWKFALSRAILAPVVGSPEFGYPFAYPLPADCLRPLFPSRVELDWKVENHDGVPSILTAEGGSIWLRYIKRVTDPTLFDPLFVEAVASRLAVQLCERLTQSNTKKEAAERAYTHAIKEARRINAIEIGRAKSPPDTWIASRVVGRLRNEEWAEE